MCVARGRFLARTSYINHHDVGVGNISVGIKHSKIGYKETNIINM